ncbi:hypothetical protein B0H10DRAFT_2212295 [Mycena sp. CBHHK59/15]|nr:hypothetical protein B0H10DRAFT_2212295 [Mycena sp. CBHHK59/15]
MQSTVTHLLLADEEDLSNTLFSTIHAIVTGGPNREHFDEYDETSNLLCLNDFAMFVLVPYVAAVLIGEDLGLEDHQEALQERKESSDFGDFMHPDDNKDEIFELLRLDLFPPRRTAAVTSPKASIRTPAASTSISTPVAPASVSTSGPLAPAISTPDTVPPPRHRRSESFKIHIPPQTNTVEQATIAEKKSVMSVREIITLDDFPEPEKKAKKTPKAKKSKPEKPESRAIKKKDKSLPVSAPATGQYGTRSRSKTVADATDQS